MPEDLTDLFAKDPRARKYIPPKKQRPGRNDACYCGSGRKYKKCCMLRDEAESN